jgi:hypothetical protein
MSAFVSRKEPPQGEWLCSTADWLWRDCNNKKVMMTPGTEFRIMHYLDGGMLAVRLRDGGVLMSDPSQPPAKMPVPKPMRSAACAPANPEVQQPPRSKVRKPRSPESRPQLQVQIIRERYFPTWVKFCIAFSVFEAARLILGVLPV